MRFVVKTTFIHTQYTTECVRDSHVCQLFVSLTGLLAGHRVTWLTSQFVNGKVSLVLLNKSTFFRAHTNSCGWHACHWYVRTYTCHGINNAIIKPSVTTSKTAAHITTHYMNVVNVQLLRQNQRNIRHTGCSLIKHDSYVRYSLSEFNNN